MALWGGRVPWNQVALARKYGRQYGVDPRLLLAIGGHETEWGRTGAGRPSQGGYALGYGVTDSGILNQYAGLANQYRFAAKTLAGWGARSMADVLAGRASRYATDPGWESGVSDVFRGLGALPAGLGASVADAVYPDPPRRQPPVRQRGMPPPPPGVLGSVAGPPTTRYVSQRVFNNQALAQGIFSALAAGGTPDVASLVGSSWTTRQIPVTVPGARRPIMSRPSRPGALPPLPKIPRGRPPKHVGPGAVGVPGGWFSPTQGKIIGTPGSGTHTLGNWESDRALDISVPEGTPIYSPFAGTIGSQFGSLGAGPGSRFGGLRLHVQNPTNEWYGAHLSRFAPGIRPGVRVRPGQLLGYSGIAAGVPHLHEALKFGDPYRLIR